MLIDWLKSALQNAGGKNKLFVRTQLKEVVQDYILNFIYNDKDHKNLIFTGGTCLRKVYGLPRLSEDLDFNYTQKFNIADFSQKLTDYFAGELQYTHVEVKIAKNSRTVFLKFPKLLAEVGFAGNMSESQMLFVRCDFNFEENGDFGTTVNAISTPDFSFFVRSYDLSTLFANKIMAFLNRKFFKGEQQAISLKGRDLFDISWFLAESAKTGFGLQPRWSRLFKEFGSTDKKNITDAVIAKVEKVKRQDLVADLYPFIESGATIDSFGENFKLIVREKLILLASH